MVPKSGIMASNVRLTYYSLNKLYLNIYVPREIIKNILLLLLLILILKI